MWGMVFPRSGISSGNPADDAKLVDILPKWLSCATKLEIRQATLEKPCYVGNLPGSYVRKEPLVLLVWYSFMIFEPGAGIR